MHPLHLIGACLHKVEGAQAILDVACQAPFPAFLQPEWERRDKAVALIMDYIRTRPHWRLSLQTHKYLGVR